MKISVVTPSFNQGDYIEETIDSVLSQNYSELEYIVIDGGSTDQSVEIIKKYEKHLHYWVSEPDGGQTQALHKGFNKATGEIFCYLNSDDVYFDGVFEKVNRIFSENSDAGLVYGDNAILYPDGRLVGKPKIAYDFDICLNAFLMISQPSAFWSKKLHHALNGFNEKYQYCFDYDFFLRAGEHLKNTRNGIVHVKDLWSKFRVHDSSKTITSQVNFSQETKDLRKQFGFIGNPLLRPLIKHYYLAKTLFYYYQQRGMIPLSSGPGSI